MPKRYAVVDITDLQPFLARHARAGRDAAPAFLLGLSLRPDGVFDLHDDVGRAMVAVLIHACDNSGDAAELVLLACRVPERLTTHPG